MSFAFRLFWSSISYIHWVFKPAEPWTGDILLHVLSHPNGTFVCLPEPQSSCLIRLPRYLYRLMITVMRRSTPDNFWVLSHRFNSATGEQKEITQTIYTDSEPPSRMPNSLMPSAKLRKANLPVFTSLVWRGRGSNPGLPPPSGRSNQYATRVSWRDWVIMYMYGVLSVPSNSQCNNLRIQDLAFHNSFHSSPKNQFCATLWARINFITSYWQQEAQGRWQSVDLLPDETTM